MGDILLWWKRLLEARLKFSQIGNAFPTGDSPVWKEAVRIGVKVGSH